MNEGEGEGESKSESESESHGERGRYVAPVAAWLVRVSTDTSGMLYDDASLNVADRIPAVTT